MLTCSWDASDVSVSTLTVLVFCDYPKSGGGGNGKSQLVITLSLKSLMFVVGSIKKWGVHQLETFLSPVPHATTEVR